ncbi:Peroxisomal membrane protein PEX14-like [Oopsacas minuta]|uniref:Peroxisomal membrane protein PEX14 n=1 Tax=Oopsacas minuta TaxID=111878 RepID=A0AAV7JYY5_9METZ|nr:Peroxisomal membrane protein PEX14-like [Oopsacas minuta]
MSDNKSLPNKMTSPVRNHLLSSAIRFLNTPEVKGTSIRSQTEFLKKKGLTQQEINSALSSVNNIASNTKAKSDNKLCIALSYSLIPESLTKVYGPIRVILTLTRAAISIIVLLYIGYRVIELIITLFPRLREIFYRLYVKIQEVLGLKPNETVGSEQPTEGLSLDSLQDVQRLEDIQLINMTELAAVADTDQREIEIINTELNELRTKQESSINELKSEIKSIRSLLLSTSQFPKPQSVTDSSELVQQEDIDCKPSGLFHARSMIPTPSSATDDIENITNNKDSQAMDFLNSLSTSCPADKPDKIETD